MRAGILALATVAAVAAAQPAPREAASEHFERGAAFFEEGNLPAALAEFEAAQRLAPAAATLYNLALVHAAMGDPVTSVDRYEAYLEASEDLSPGRRREIEAAMAEQRGRIAVLDVDVDVEGAFVAIDGADVGTTPLPPLRVGAGEHTVVVRASGRLERRAVVSVAGQERRRVSLRLPEATTSRGRLVVRAALPDVAIAIDGRDFGEAPQTLDLDVGVHRVTARRPGYLTQTVEAEVLEGAEAILELALTVDPAAPTGALAVRVPDLALAIRVDGEAVPTTASDGVLRVEELPAGGHRLDLEVADHEPVSLAVEVRAGQRTTVAPGLRLTPQARQDRLEDARRGRRAGQGLFGVGAALSAGFGGLFIWNRVEIAATDAEVIALDCPNPCTLPRAAELTADQDRQDRIQIGAGVALGVAITLATVGVVLWVLRGQEESRLVVGPDGAGARF